MSTSPDPSISLDDLDEHFSLARQASLTPDADQTIQFFSGKNVPVEMHRVVTVKRLYLKDVDARRAAIESAGNNMYLLTNDDVFLDMLTDSGVNSMSIVQQAAMGAADDAYAGSATFTRLSKAVEYLLGTKYLLPAHQGRACENILSETFVRPGSHVLTNYHFTTTRAHITRRGGSVTSLVPPTSLDPQFDAPFKGDMDVDRLATEVDRLGTQNISFVRIEAGTNLLGGQPVSLANMRAVSQFCRERGLMLVMDASLLADNLYFIKTREAAERGKTIREIALEIGALMDVTYFSGRKLGCARGGGIATNDVAIFDKMKPLLPFYEGFLTYGGMSVHEMEAMAVGLIETCDFHVISQTAIFVQALVQMLEAKGIPCVTPAGGLGCHIDAKRFLPNIPQGQYPAGALAVATYLVSGVRGMERGSLSEDRDANGVEHPASMELMRLAVPKRAFTLSQLEFVADRMGWLYEHRDLVGGIEFVDEPPTMRGDIGRLAAVDDWPEKLVAAFKKDMPSLL